MRHVSSVRRNGTVQPTPLLTRTVRASALLAQGAVVWLAAVLVAPRLSPSRCNALVARLAAQTLATVDVHVRARGARPYVDGPVLFVANHVSWLDIYALNAVLGGARSLAKIEVAGWPVAGTIARGFRTFFHVRGSCRDAARVKDAVAAALRAGERVIVFPEGTTTEGHTVGRFHAAFLQAAIDANVPVQPVAIRYPTRDGTPDPAAAFVGDTTFAVSLARVLRRGRLEANLTFGPVIPPGPARRDLARLAHGFVALALDCARTSATRRSRVVALRRAPSPDRRTATPRRSMRAER